MAMYIDLQPEEICFLLVLRRGALCRMATACSSRRDDQLPREEGKVTVWLRVVEREVEAGEHVGDRAGHWRGQRQAEGGLKTGLQRACFFSPFLEEHSMLFRWCPSKFVDKELGGGREGMESASGIYYSQAQHDFVEPISALLRVRCRQECECPMQLRANSEERTDTQSLLMSSKSSSSAVVVFSGWEMLAPPDYAFGKAIQCPR
jgi:hypothetical protein